MFNNFALSTMKVKDSQDRIARQRRRRSQNAAIIVGGIVAAGGIELLDHLSVKFFGTHSLEGWSIMIIGATLVIYAAVELIRSWLWQDDDRIYENEFDRLSK